MSFDFSTAFDRSSWNADYRGYTFTLNSNALAEDRCYMFYAPCDDSRNITRIVAQKLKTKISYVEGSLNTEDMEREEGKPCIANIRMDYLSFPKEHLETCLKVGRGFERDRNRLEIYTNIDMDIKEKECQIRMGDTVHIPFRENILIFRSNSS